MKKTTGINDALTEAAEVCAMDPALMVAVKLAEVEVLRIQGEWLLAHCPPAEDRPELRDMSPLGR